MNRARTRPHVNRIGKNKTKTIIEESPNLYAVYKGVAVGSTGIDIANGISEIDADAFPIDFAYCPALFLVLATPLNSLKLNSVMVPNLLLYYFVV